jgi:endogenous inhibitor of DNA gyrase (YacG/DUF329 family)
MFVFGWGGRCRVMGDAGACECPRCGNTSRWQVLETSKSASVYFLPVAKWDKHYFVACPICNAGIALRDREHAQELLLEALERESRSRILASLLSVSRER